MDGIYGGQLLGVRSASGLTFYNWETTSLVRRIEVAPQQVNSKLILVVQGGVVQQLWLFNRQYSRTRCKLAMFQNLLVMVVSLVL